MTRELIIDSFAGGGGASLGIELALGRSPDVAINHDAEAIALHAANHPHTRHYREDVWKVDPRAATGGQPVGLMWLSPDCFPAGTLVLTERGYLPIESISVGDRVLTHRGRYRRVTETSRARRPLMAIRGHGHPGLLVSPEHPFYTRAHSRETPEWTPASLLTKGQYWATPASFPALEIPVVPGRALLIDERLMWLAGRYVGDGWTRLTKDRAELVITCAKSEATTLRAMLDRWPRAGARSSAGELAWQERATATAYQFTTNHRGLVTWLREHFRHRAESKALPAWALGMEKALREALLNGYMSADGHDRGTFREAHTVSKALACSVKLLAQSLGHTVTMYVHANSIEIEGRTVNARPLYKLRWRHKVDAARAQTFASGGLRWTPIREVGPTTHEATVYNIGVEGDESYVAEGIVVHNCKHFSKAKGGKPVSKRVRGLAWVAVRWAKAVQPRVIVLENVEEFQTWGPLGDNGRPCPARRGLTFRRFVGRLRNLGYEVQWRELRACDYGAPTIRKRLFLIARCDGRPIVWPRPTHGKGTPRPWRTAAECIDFTIPTPSIFLTPAEAKAWGLAYGRPAPRRPLAEATMRRIGAGLRRFVIDTPRPFLVQVQNASAGDTAIDLDKPMRTVTAHPKGGGFALVSAFIAKHQTERGNEVQAASLFDPVPTVKTRDSNALVTSTLVSLRGGEASHEHGDAITEPLRTVSAGGTHHAEVRAFLVAYYGNERDGGDLFSPMRTVTSRERFGLVTVDGHAYAIADIGMRMLEARELYRAQGFPDSYRIDIPFDGKPMTKEAQVRMCGNSVCPPMAAALVAANLGDLARTVVAA